MFYFSHIQISIVMICSLQFYCTLVIIRLCPLQPYPDVKHEEKLMLTDNSIINTFKNGIAFLVFETGKFKGIIFLYDGIVCRL